MAAGRPTKLTSDLTKQIAKLLTDGNYVETVCDYVGLSRSTFYEWLERGENAEAGTDQDFVEFSDTIKKAIASVEMDTVKAVRRGPTNWQSKAWWLERRHPDKWGNRGKQQLEHTGKDGEPIKQNSTVTHAIDAESAQSIFDILAAAGAIAAGADAAEADGVHTA
jgi:transposase